MEARVKATGEIIEVKGVFGMTRREEIKHKAGSISDGMIANNVPHSECKGYYEGYIDGAEWADKTMIEKACKYAAARYDLDYCGNIRDVLNYLKSLVEE